VIAWDEHYHGIRVLLKYVKECHGNRNTSAAIQGLVNDARVIHVPQFLAVVSFMCTRHNEHLSSNRKKRFETGPRLGEEALSPEDRTKLFWPGITRDL
jgi:hypothetical protein